MLPFIFFFYSITPPPQFQHPVPGLSTLSCRTAARACTARRSVAGSCYRQLQSNVSSLVYSTSFFASCRTGRHSCWCMEFLTPIAHCPLLIANCLLYLQQNQSVGFTDIWKFFKRCRSLQFGAFWCIIYKEVYILHR